MQTQNIANYKSAPNQRMTKKIYCIYTTTSFEGFAFETELTPSTFVIQFRTLLLI